MQAKWRGVTFYAECPFLVMDIVGYFAVNLSSFRTSRWSWLKPKFSCLTLGSSMLAVSSLLPVSATCARDR